MTTEKHLAATERELELCAKRLQQESELRRTAEGQLLFQTQLLDSIRESVVATDLEGNVTFWGPGAEALYQYRAEKVMGKSITFLVAPSEREEEEARMRQVQQTGLWSGTYQQLRKDGSKFFADCVISLVREKNGSPVGYISVDRDVTDRMRMEHALKESERYTKTSTKTRRTCVCRWIRPRP